MSMDEQLYTRNQISKQYGIKTETMAKILRGVPPDGKIAKYPAYTIDTFEQAKKAYYSAAVEEIEEEEPTEVLPVNGAVDEQTAAAVLRIKLAEAERKELDNAERKHTLVSRPVVEGFFHFLNQLFALKIRELTKDKGDEFFNEVVEAIYKDIEAYVNEEGLSDIINEGALDSAEKELSNPPAQPTEEWSV